MMHWRLAELERWFLRAGAFVLPLAYAWNTHDKYAVPKLVVARAFLFGRLTL
jgi:hypothetical protein